MEDRGIIQWDKRLTDQARRGWDNYKHLHIDLGVARIDQSYLIAGEYLYVEESSSALALAKIKLNRSNNDMLDLEKGVKIETVFIEIFIINDVIQDEWIDLVFGINFKYYREAEAVEPAEPERFLANPCIILTAANNICTRALIRAHTGNAGTIWIDFGPPAVVNNCYELTPGDAISVPLSNTNWINGILTVGGDRATIVFENVI